MNFDIDIKTAILALLFKIVQSIEQVPLGYFDIELPFKKKKKNFTTEKKKVVHNFINNTKNVKKRVSLSLRSLKGLN